MSKLKKQNIILVGMMGSGKTVTAEALVSMLSGYKLVEADEIIAKEEGMPISGIFEKYGEAYFRKRETALVERVVEEEYQVISTGGGMYVNERNKSILNKSGFVVYLSATPETVYDRVNEDDSRPLLNTDEDLMQKIKTILARRKPHYMKAHFVVETDGKTPQEVAKIVLGGYLKYGH